MHKRAQRVYVWATLDNTLDLFYAYFELVKTPLQAQNMHNKTQRVYVWAAPDTLWTYFIHVLDL
jgi:hypothetical protein